MDKSIAILSTERFAGKISEDLWLKDALSAMGEKAEIVAWEDESVEWSNYKSAVVRSCWGYHKRYADFLNFLQKLETSGVRLFNDPQIIRWNIRKDLQFKKLNRYDIHTVPSYFIQGDMPDLAQVIAQCPWAEKYENLVIKPTVSGSGDNTFVLSSNNKHLDLNNQLSLSAAQSYFQQETNQKHISGIMLQPFLPGVSAGEYSFVFIGSQLTHIAVRYPGIFAPKKDPAEIAKTQIADDMMQFASQCQQALFDISASLKQNLTPVYMRCDIVRSDGKLFLMEAEMTEPDLLIKTISSPEIRSDVIKKLAIIISEQSN